MFEKNAALFLYAVSPVHMGAGQAVGVQVAGAEQVPAGAGVVGAAVVAFGRLRRC